MSRIVINCGGQQFETYVGTLEKSPVLKMLLKRWNQQEPFFLDEDPKRFRHVLNMLRNPKCTLELDTNLVENLVSQYQIPSVSSICPSENEEDNLKENKIPVKLFCKIFSLKLQIRKELVGLKQDISDRVLKSLYKVISVSELGLSEYEARNVVGVLGYNVKTQKNAEDYICILKLWLEIIGMRCVDDWSGFGTW